MLDNLNKKIDEVVAAIQNQPNHEYFRKELTSLINKYSFESVSNTPDYILANYLMACLAAFNEQVKARSEWYNYNESDSVCGQLDEKIEGIHTSIYSAITKHLSEIYSDVKIISVEYVSPLTLSVKFGYRYCLGCGVKYDKNRSCDRDCPAGSGMMEETLQLNEEFLWTI